MSDGKDLVDQAQGKDLVSQDQPSGASMLAMVAAAAKDPTIDADKMKTLADLAIQMQDREAERRFRDAKKLAIENMPSIGKRGEILNKSGRVQSRFSRFEDLHGVVAPILKDHHLSLDWKLGNSASGQILVEAILTYSDGELAYSEGGGALPFPIDNQGGKSPVQGVASSVSMGKRHTMKAMLNIKEHDENPGEAGSHGPEVTEQEEVLINEARSAASDGVAAYKQFFGNLNAAQKGFLVSRTDESGKTYHDQNKDAAEKFDKGAD